MGKRDEGLEVLQDISEDLHISRVMNSTLLSQWVVFAPSPTFVDLALTQEEKGFQRGTEIRTGQENVGWTSCTRRWTQLTSHTVLAKSLVLAPERMIISVTFRARLIYTRALNLASW